MPKNKVDKFIKNPNKALLKLSFPILIAMAVQAMYNIVDTAFVGRLGADSIAALTFAFPLFFLIIAVDSGIGTGMGSRISRYLGAKKKSSAENAAMHGLFISIISAVIFFILGMIFLRPLFSLFGASNSVLLLSIDYMSIVLIGIFFMFPAYVIGSIFTSQGDTKTPTKIQIAALVLNMILDPIFIYVLGYGVKGAAIATSISFFFALVLSVYFLMGKSYLKIRMSSFSFSPKIIKDIFYVGAPASLTMVFMSFYVIFLNRFMAHFGTDYVAAFGIASRLESVAVMPIVALSVALLTLVGMFYGAKKYNLIKNLIWYSVKCGVIFTSFIGLLFFIFPSLFLRIFTPDAGLISIGADYLRVSVFAFPLMAIGLQIGRALQGMGFGLPSLVVTVIRIFIVAIPLAYAFVFIFDMSYIYIAVAMVIGAICSVIVAVIWLQSVLRKRINIA